MKTQIFILFVLVANLSCSKENTNTELFDKYKTIEGVWEPLTISYDSADTRVTKPIEYEKLVINNDLSYEVYLEEINLPIENGNVKILTQTKDILEINFAAKYPINSSLSGSHIFGHDNVALDSITTDKLIFESTSNLYFENTAFSFKKSE